MTQNNDDSTAKTPAEKLAEMVARKAAIRNGRPGGPANDHQSQRAANAAAASKSKPAMRKG